MSALLLFVWGGFPFSAVRPTLQVLMCWFNSGVGAWLTCVELQCQCDLAVPSLFVVSVGLVVGSI